MNRLNYLYQAENLASYRERRLLSQFNRAEAPSEVERLSKLHDTATLWTKRINAERRKAERSAARKASKRGAV